VRQRFRREIERDVIRGRAFEPHGKYLPDGLSHAAAFDFLGEQERRFVSRIQARTYASLFGLMERQALFRRLDAMMAERMPGYRFLLEAEAVAAALQQRSFWARCALNCLIELSTQVHHRLSLEPDEALDPLWKDVLLFHWEEESQHALLDEMAWRSEDAKLDAAARDRAVDDLVALMGALDALLQPQAAADAAYFVRACGRESAAGERARLEAGFLHAYRWQYIVSGVQVPHFSAILAALVDALQYGRIAAALAPLFEHAGERSVRKSNLRVA
jgi:hypothetical protein